MRLEKCRSLRAVWLVVALAVAGCHTVRGPVDLTGTRLQNLPIRDNDTLRAHYINVGAGMCHVVQCPGTDGTVILDDCGSSNTNKAMDREQTREYVRSLVKGHPLKVVITHTDADHSNWIPYVLDSLPTGTSLTQVWAGGSYSEYSDKIQKWMSQKAATWGANVVVNGYPDSTSIPLPVGWSNDLDPVTDLSCGAAASYVLTVNSKPESNASSLMLRLAYASRSLVFPGDATKASQDRAIANAHTKAGFLKTDILEMSHHGADTDGSNNTVWATATSPFYVVASAGESYGHPRCTSVDNYKGAAGDVASHPLWCGISDTTWKERFYKKAIYGTNTQGLIIGDVDKSGTIAFHCGATSGPCQ